MNGLFIQTDGFAELWNQKPAREQGRKNKSQNISAHVPQSALAYAQASEPEKLRY